MIKQIAPQAWFVTNAGCSNHILRNLGLQHRPGYPSGRRTSRYFLVGWKEKYLAITLRYDYCHPYGAGCLGMYAKFLCGDLPFDSHCLYTQSRPHHLAVAPGRTHYLEVKVLSHFCAVQLHKPL